MVPLSKFDERNRWKFEFSIQDVEFKETPATLEEMQVPDGEMKSLNAMISNSGYYFVMGSIWPDYYYRVMPFAPLPIDRNQYRLWPTVEKKLITHTPGIQQALTDVIIYGKPAKIWKHDMKRW